MSRVTGREKSVLLIAPSREEGGVEAYLRVLAAGMIDRGFAVGTCLPDGLPLDSLKVDLRRVGATVSRLPYVWRQPLGARQVAVQIGREFIGTAICLLRVRSEAVFTMLPHPDQAPGVVLATALRRRRSIVVVHLVPPDIRFSRLRRALYSLARRTGQQWVCVSRDNAALLTEALAWPVGAVGIVYNGVPTFPASTAEQRAQVGRSLRERLGLPDDAPIVLSVGRLNVQKGLDLVLEAMPSVLAEVPQAQWVWAGDGPERDSLLSRATELGVEKHLTLLGRVDWVRELMLGSDVLLFPSRYEGFALTVLEAQMAGLPVIVSNTGSLPEMVRPEVDGVVVPPADPVALASATVEALRHPEVGRDRAMTAGHRVRSEFSADAMIDQTLALTPELIRGADAPRRLL
jgi:glycosyltransferase involved in cell wall biosynthesis